MIDIEDIQFILVLYKESLYSSKTYLSLSNNLKQLNAAACLFVYDNSPILQEVNSSDDCWRITYFHDPNNSGLSVAYNSGARQARMNGKKWLFLLDQDTLFVGKSLETYMQAVREYSDYKLFAPILQIQNGKYMSPCKYKHKWGKVRDYVDPGVYSFSDSAPVNSGLLIDVHAFWQAGGYNERVRVDGCDFQFMERFKIFQQKYVVIDLTLQQEFSFFEPSVEKQFERFTMFLKDVRNFERSDSFDNVLFFWIAFKRSLFLTVQTGRLRFLLRFFNIFLTSKDKC